MYTLHTIWKTLCALSVKYRTLWKTSIVAQNNLLAGIWQVNNPQELFKLFWIVHASVFRNVLNEEQCSRYRLDCSHKICASIKVPSSFGSISYLMLGKLQNVWWLHNCGEHRCKAVKAPVTADNINNTHLTEAVLWAWVVGLALLPPSTVVLILRQKQGCKNWTQGCAGKAIFHSVISIPS